MSEQAEEHAPDPRRTNEYVSADPRTVVEDEGVVMGAPGGAPQEDESVDERRARDRE
jgi:hypothetical protein